MTSKLAICYAGGVQASEVAAFLQHTMRFANVRLREDLRGVERFVTARR